MQPCAVLRTGRLSLRPPHAAGVVSVTGLMQWTECLGSGLAVLQEWVVRPQFFSYSLPSLLVTLNYVFHGMKPPPEAVNVGWLVAQVAGVALIAAAYLACWRHPDEEMEFCLLTVAMLAGSGLVWGYYYVFLIFPVAVAAVRMAARFTPRRGMGFAIILLLLNDLGTWSGGCGIHDISLRALLHTPPTLGLLGLGWFLLRELRAVPPRPPSATTGWTAGRHVFWVRIS